jgi:hypothetical protein
VPRLVLSSDMYISLQTGNPLGLEEVPGCWK